MKKRVKRHAVTQPLDKPYRLIPLTQGKNAIVDTADFEWLSQWNWRTSWNQKNLAFYAARTVDGAVRPKKNILMHRQILGCEGKEESDHENHNGLDNRRENLRKCTSSNNKWNMRLSTRNKSGFKGICRVGRRFYTKVFVHGKPVTGGRGYDTPEEAARVYDKLAKEHHGEFACLNFPLAETWNSTV